MRRVCWERLRDHNRCNFVLDNKFSPFYNGSVNQDRLNTKQDRLNTQPSTNS